MDDRNKALKELHDKIEDLVKKQKAFQEEIQKLNNAVFEFERSERAAVKSSPAQTPTEAVVEKTPPIKVNVYSPSKNPNPPQVKVEQPAFARRAMGKNGKSPLEEFVGTNLLNKAGIALLVAGIGVGAKYSIDHELLNPLTRIILGYLAGITLIVVALRLKKAHENFSAVLLSGGMAVLYFLTYAAYDFYDLLPQTIAFVLMVIYTGFTVFAAMQYNREVIGIIGLVGAYAVPFLLSDGSGRVVILFSYISIINTGILILAFKKYWKRLYYLAFTLTWISFCAWFSFDFDEQKHFWTSLTFSTVFFITFYTTFLAYKLIRKEPLGKLDLVFMLLNSFVYYGFGYITIDSAEGAASFLGLFTLFTAVIHFIACQIIYRQQSHLKDVFYFVAGMVLIFLTIAVPVQLEGNWVTLVWAFEAALLFWIGRTKAFPVYEKLSYPLIFLAFLSLIHDWANTYPDVYFYTYNEFIRINFLLNVQFATTLLTTLALGFILWQSNQKRFPSPLQPNALGERVFTFGLPLLTLFILYIGVFKEVETLWNIRYADSKIYAHADNGDTYDLFDENLLKFKTLWLIYYSAIFAIAFSVLQISFIKNRYGMLLSLAINVLVIFAFITSGLIELSDLRSSYLLDSNNQYYYRDLSNILVRYVGLILIIPLMFINYRYLKNDFFNEMSRQTEQVLFHAATLVLLSSELVHWLDMARIENSFKLALSILWGAYALFLIILGLWKDLRHIRIAAFMLFGITLIKLFFYDIADMSTIAKTIVMIILGVLLLTASFLYNKYKRSTGNEIQ